MRVRRWSVPTQTTSSAYTDDSITLHRRVISSTQPPDLATQGTPLVTRTTPSPTRSADDALKRQRRRVRRQPRKAARHFVDAGDALGPEVLPSAERPINIEWDLEHPMRADVLRTSAVVA